MNDETRTVTPRTEAGRELWANMQSWFDNASPELILSIEDEAAALPTSTEGLTQAAQAMWYVHTEDERFAGAPPTGDPYGDFERALLASLSPSPTEKNPK